MTRGEVTLNNVYNTCALIDILIVLLCIYNDDYLTKNEDTLVI